MAIIKWSSYGSYTAAFSAGDLKNKSNTARVLSGAIDNSSDCNRWIDLTCAAKYGTAPSAGGYVAVYLIPAVDGTNYADGDASVLPQASLLLAVFALKASTSQQLLASTRIMIPPCKFKLLWENQAGQTSTNTDSENMVSYRMYNESAA
ncbi:MAG: hypothetical protein IT209_00840 [Armatimonadetes bacterium]|nr:hypothetical protein [Armatimonadota bacterium]